MTHEPFTGFLQGNITAQELMDKQKEKFKQELSERHKQHTDPVNPDYYKGFSNGAEVIDISEHLTGNGSQAVQYIARATRIDGKVKDNPKEDLRKARWLLDRELSRLEEGQDDEHA